MTQHPNGILNPDAVHEWATSGEDSLAMIRDRASRAAALLPNVAKYFPAELPRAEQAVALWASYCTQ